MHFDASERGGYISDPYECLAAKCRVQLKRYDAILLGAGRHLAEGDHEAAMAAVEKAKDCLDSTKHLNACAENYWTRPPIGPSIPLHTDPLPEWWSPSHQQRRSWI